MPNGKLSKPASTVLVRVINPAQVSSPFDSIQVHHQNPDSAIKHGFLSPSDISDRCYSPSPLHSSTRPVDHQSWRLAFSFESLTADRIDSSPSLPHCLPPGGWSRECRIPR